MKTIEEMKESYDWQEAFAYAGFTMDDVECVIASDDGENDGQSWIAVFHLKNDSYAYLEAGCDYTGWDCQADGTCWVKTTLEEIQRWDMPKTSRVRLGMTLADLDGDQHISALNEEPK